MSSCLEYDAFFLIQEVVGEQKVQYPFYSEYIFCKAMTKKYPITAVSFYNKEMYNNIL